jgi:hypothetical protein
MSRVIPLSRHFLSGHPRKGQPTYFVEKFLSSIGQAYRRDWYKITLQELNPWMSQSQVIDFVESLENIGFEQQKYHTVRAGTRWKKGDLFSPRAWSGKPYATKQIILWHDLPVQGTWTFQAGKGFNSNVLVDGKSSSMHFLRQLAWCDGLDLDDFWDWIIAPSVKKDFDGQVISWNKQINYTAINYSVEKVV